MSSVQLRPTVKNMGKALQVDISLLERLYSYDAETPGMRKTMLDVQYRFSQELNAFPSREFYEGRLMTGNMDSATILQPLLLTAFPWPKNGDLPIPTVFVQCSAEEDMGGRSKSNIGQVELVQNIIPLLTKNQNGEESGRTVTVLTPYTKQIQELRSRVPPSIVCSTVDAFQGRESDVIVFSTVRCNAEGEIGFLDDPRRLNVMWTRAKLALVIVGDRRTMSTNDLWKRAIEACQEVHIAVDASG
jgi:superfamily I DNA and/or RNA helicase